jgi:acyl carrier protein
MPEHDLEATVLDTLADIVPNVDPAQIDPDKSFRDQIEIDSVDFMNFMVSLEQRLGVEIPELDYPKLSSLRGCTTYLASTLANDYRI